MQIRQTIGAPAFDKFYLEGPWNDDGLHPDLHHIKAPDLGAPHDHPWDMRSLVLKGWYVEEIFLPDGSTYRVRHEEGDTFIILGEHVHRIVDAAPVCWTIAVPLCPPYRCWGYYEWRDGVCYKRDHDKPDAVPFTF